MNRSASKADPGEACRFLLVCRRGPQKEGANYEDWRGWIECIPRSAEEKERKESLGAEGRVSFVRLERIPDALGEVMRRMAVERWEDSGNTIEA